MTRLVCLLAAQSYHWICINLLFQATRGSPVPGYESCLFIVCVWSLLQSCGNQGQLVGFNATKQRRNPILWHLTSGPFISTRISLPIFSAGSIIVLLINLAVYVLARQPSKINGTFALSPPDIGSSAQRLAFPATHYLNRCVS